MSLSLFFELGKGSGLAEFEHFLGSTRSDSGEFGFALGERKCIVLGNLLFEIHESLIRFLVGNGSIGIFLGEVILLFHNDRKNETRSEVSDESVWIGKQSRIESCFSHL